MEQYYRERFETQQRLAHKISHLTEVNAMLETIRAELRAIIPVAMESCILLLDPEARRYTRPLQCALHDRPVNCLSCKRNRPAIQKAIQEKRPILASRSSPVVRQDQTLVEIGPEAAFPVLDNEALLAVVSVVARPGTRFTKKDFLLLQDVSDTLTHVLLNAKRQWVMTQEKIRISQMLAHLSPFVPHSVRKLVEKDPNLLDQEKEKREVTVLFLDLEGYTRLSSLRPDTEINALVERIFSSFVDPIQRSRGDINETSGDGLMILFKDDDARTNAIHAVKAAFDIHDLNLTLAADLPPETGPLHVNMGLNSGTALLGMTRFKGSLATRMTYTASGPVTNLAARLAAHARGGDILIGEETRRLIDGFWPTYDLGLVALKGIEEPLRVYSLLRRPDEGLRQP